MDEIIISKILVAKKNNYFFISAEGGTKRGQKTRLCRAKTKQFAAWGRFSVALWWCVWRSCICILAVFEQGLIGAAAIQQVGQLADLPDNYGHVRTCKQFAGIVFSFLFAAKPQKSPPFFIAAFGGNV
jgi:hypothetical protein